MRLSFILLILFGLQLNASEERLELRVYNHINKSLGNFLDKDQYSLKVSKVDPEKQAIYVKLSLDNKLTQVENDAINLLIDGLNHGFPKATFYLQTFDKPQTVTQVYASVHSTSEMMYTSFFFLLLFGSIAGFIFISIPERKNKTYRPYKLPNKVPTITSHRLSKDEFMKMDLFLEFVIRRPAQASRIIRKCLWGNVDVYTYAINAIDRLIDPVTRVKIQYYLNDKDLKRWSDKLAPSLSTENLAVGINHLAKNVRHRVLNTKYQYDNELAFMVLKMTTAKIKQFINEDNVEAAYLVNMVNNEYLSLHLKGLDEHSINFLLHGSLAHNRISKNRIEEFKESLFCYI
jgi:hypothetical protein